MLKRLANRSFIEILLFLLYAGLPHHLIIICQISSWSTLKETSTRMLLQSGFPKYWVT